MPVEVAKYGALLMLASMIVLLKEAMKGKMRWGADENVTVATLSMRKQPKNQEGVKPSNASGSSQSEVRAYPLPK